MARKKKHKSTKNKSKAKTAKVNASSADDLLAQGNQAKENADYKAALKAYKKLWGISQTEKIRSLLAETYMHRARELAHKRMYCEACALWVSREVLKPEDLCVTEYVRWLISVWTEMQ